MGSSGKKWISAARIPVICMHTCRILASNYRSSAVDSVARVVIVEDDEEEDGEVASLQQRR